MVDPSMTVWPSRDDFDAPLYRNGGFVPWDIDAWDPALPSCMLGAAKAQNRGRGQLYTGDLTAYRDDRLGRATRPSSWDGYAYEALRGMARAEEEAAARCKHPEVKAP